MVIPIVDGSFLGFAKVIRHVAERKHLDDEKDAAWLDVQEDRQTET